MTWFDFLSPGQVADLYESERYLEDEGPFLTWPPSLLEVTFHLTSPVTPPHLSPVTPPHMSPVTWHLSPQLTSPVTTAE